MKIFISVLLTLGFFCSTVALAAPAPLINIKVGQARTKAAKLAFPPIKVAKGRTDMRGQLKVVHNVVVEDLAFSGLFTFISPKAFLENPAKTGIKKGSFKFSDWTSIGTQFLMRAEGHVAGGQIAIELYLYATFSSKTLLAKKYRASTSTLRKLGHTISNDIMKALTGREGPFTAKIAFISDKSGKKRLYIMDYDGHNIVEVKSSIINRASFTIAPAWSPDGNKLVFSALVPGKNNISNHNLYEYNVKTGAVSLLSNKKGLNSGATYSPDGREIALTMSFKGNPEIYTMNPITKQARRTTKAIGFDVDPSFSPDGNYLAFVSDRSGSPMIYRMKRDGTETKRLTIAGRYNATPSWSPTNNKIAFAGWIDSRFDIFIMNPDGTNIERLTKNMGKNEDPDFAPDGYFIVYSSDRLGKKNLYITNIDNTIHRRITNNFGNSYNPKWSPNF